MHYRFERLEIWQLARAYVSYIYAVTKQFPRDEIFSLINQLRRAALSILLNIAEGSARGSDTEFARFLRIAYSSLNEVIAACYVALDQQYLEKEKFDELYNKSHYLGKKINAFIQVLHK